MTVYVVTSGYDYEVGAIDLVTTDREKAEAEATHWAKSRDYAIVEKWDAVTGEQDCEYVFHL